MRTRNRSTWAAAVTTVGVAVAMTLAGCAGDEPKATGPDETEAPAPASVAPSPTATVEQAPEYTPEEQKAIEAAKAAVVRYFEVMDAAYAAPKSHGADAFDDVAIEPVKKERLGVLGYLTTEESHQVGSNSVEIVEVKSVETVSNPEEFVYPEVYFDICVDSSGIKFVDGSGETIPSEIGARQSAVIGAYEEPGDGWFVHHEEHKGEGGACKK